MLSSTPPPASSTSPPAGPTSTRVHRARSVAEETIQAHPALTKVAAAWVDAQVTPFAAGIGHAQIQRMVTEAIRRFQLADPALADGSDEACGANRRKVELMGDLMPYTSTVHVEAVLSVADALDLDRNLTHRAATLAALGSTEPLDTRRSQALGDLAREQTALDLTRSRIRSGIAYPLGVSRMLRSMTGFTVILRDGTCVFPWCSRPARACQIDHVVPYDHHAGGAKQPGQTATDNLAALCTRHHRLKTDGRWRYAVIGPGEYVWRDGYGNHYLRDHHGSREAAPAEPARP